MNKRFGIQYLIFLLCFLFVPFAFAQLWHVAYATNSSLSLAGKNKQAGEKFLNHNRSRDGVVTLATGLQYRVFQEGNGPRPGMGDVVTMDYEGKHINGAVFDSTHTSGKPIVIAVNSVMLGWQEALLLMHVGAIWEIVVPSSLAYGRGGLPGSVGPNETLIYRIHLLSIRGKDSHQQDLFSMFSNHKTKAFF